VAAQRVAAARLKVAARVAADSAAVAASPVDPAVVVADLAPR
jgi:hypothetical protein